MRARWTSRGWVSTEAPEKDRRCEDPGCGQSLTASERELCHRCSAWEQGYEEGMGRRAPGKPDTPRWAFGTYVAGLNEGRARRRHFERIGVAP